MSAIIGGLLPKIEGFQPIPNAVMIPFMETQSAALAFGFGLNYEFGKRTIRSMSNDKFNSLTSEQIAEMSANHSTILLNRFIQAVPQVMPAQTEIFKQYVTIEKAKVLQNFALAKWTLADLPGILLGLNIDIKDLERDLSPSKTGTTITQDKEGNVTTTTAPSSPVNHTVELTETLPLTDKKETNGVLATLYLSQEDFLLVFNEKNWKLYHSEWYTLSHISGTKTQFVPSPLVKKWNEMLALHKYSHARIFAHPINKVTGTKTHRFVIQVLD